MIHNEINIAIDVSFVNNNGLKFKFHGSVMQLIVFTDYNYYVFIPKNK